jgi:hypothetical protein
MRDRKLAGLLAGVSMTAIEQRAGRFLRAPDHTAGDGFEGSGAWSEPDAGAPPAKGAEAAAAGDDDAGKTPVDNSGADEGDEGAGDDDQGGADEGDEGEAGEEDADKKPEKRQKKAVDRIRELNGRLRESERERERERGAFEARIAALENRGKGSTNGNGADNQDGPVKPDPNDTDKYPLGSLDDRYIDDMIEYAAEKKASEKIDGCSNVRSKQRSNGTPKSSD